MIRYYIFVIKTFIVGKFFESDIYSFQTEFMISISFYDQAGTNKAIFSIFIGLHPFHFTEPEPPNTFAIADIGYL
jgi:hypothetical protein